MKDCDWIVTQDPQRQVLRDSSVRIIEGRIDEIGKLQPNAKDNVIDCKRKALIPGLINTHTHLSMSLFRGYADDLELREWLEKKIWPLEARLDGEMCYHGALLGSEWADDKFKMDWNIYFSTKTPRRRPLRSSGRYARAKYPMTKR